MTTRRLAMIAAALEATAGFALIAIPGVVVRLLIGASISSGGIAVGRVGGFGLLSLGLACWPAGNVATAQAISALFTYNLLSSLYIAYLSVRGGFDGYLLWPAVVLHGMLALLLAHPAYETARRQWLGIHFPKITIQIASETVSSPRDMAETARAIQARSQSRESADRDRIKEIKR
jgi:hypothetical protein